MIAAQLEAQGVATIKEQLFAEKNCVLSQKPSKKCFFFGLFRSTLRLFVISPYHSDDAQTHRINSQINAQGVAIIKKGTFTKKKIEFEPKTVKKVGFLGYSGLH